MSINYDKQESEEERLAKQQKHLRAKLKLMTRVPQWFEGRLKEETGLSEEELTTLLCQVDKVLPEGKLDAVWTFLRRWDAGGITERRGEEVLEERSPHGGALKGLMEAEAAERAMNGGNGHAEKPLMVCGVDVTKVRKALEMAGNGQSVAEEPVGAPSEPDDTSSQATMEAPKLEKEPEPEPNVRMEEIAGKLPAQPQTLAPAKRADIAAFMGEAKCTLWYGFCNRWEALGELRDAYGFKNRFAQRANWVTAQTVKALATRTMMYDVNDKYWWVESALKWAEGGGFVPGMEGFTPDMLEQIEREEKGSGDAAQDAPPAPEEPCRPTHLDHTQEEPLATQTVTITIPIHMLDTEIDIYEIMVDCYSEEVNETREEAEKARAAIAKHEKAIQKLGWVKDILAQLQQAKKDRA